LGHEIGNRQLVSLGNAHLSCQVYFIQGEFTKTRDAAEVAPKIASSMNDSNTAGWALGVLGLLASMNEHYREGISLCQQSASSQGIAHMTQLAAWGISLAACGLGDYDAAREFFLKSLTYMTNHRGQTGTIACLPVAAILLAHQGNPIRAVEWLALGFSHPIHASGWMEKWPLLARLRAELQQVLGSEAYRAAWERGKRLDIEEVTKEVREQFPVRRPDLNTKANLDALSSRELEVLELMAQGFTNQEIANYLYIGVSTVKKHVNHIFDKLDVKNRTSAAAYARELNLLK
jgi:ATP/maltotriose-dependent transcriptional regulator MalT